MTITPLLVISKRLLYNRDTDGMPCHLKRCLMGRGGSLSCMTHAMNAVTLGNACGRESVSESSQYPALKTKEEISLNVWEPETDFTALRP